MRQLLQHEYGGALAHHEPVAGRVERPGGVLGIVVARGRRPDRVEAGDRDRGQRRVRRSRDHDVGLTVDDELVTVPDRVDPGGTAGRDHVCRAMGGEPVGHLAGQTAGDQGVVEKGRCVAGVDKPVAPTVTGDHVLVFQPGGRADRAAHAHGYQRLVGVGGVRVPAEFQPAIGDRFGRGHEGELDETVVAGDFLWRQPRRGRVEVAFGGHLRAELARVEERQASGGCPAIGQQVPELLATYASRRDHADAGYRRPSHFRLLHGMFQRRHVSSGGAVRCPRGRVPGAAPRGSAGRQGRPSGCPR